MSAPRLTRTQSFCGVEFFATDLDGAVKWLCHAARDGWVGSVHLLNAYSIVLINRDERLRSAVSVGSVNLPDGRPLAVLSQKMQNPLTQIRGPHFFEEVMDHGRQYGLRHYLLGGSEETLAHLEVALQNRYPGITIAGSWSPPFRPLTLEETERQDEIIKGSGADLVWVGLGTPKQDLEAARIMRAVARPTIAVGAAFDFSAGTKRVAPAWVQKIGLEWLYRLLSEPRRLWKRYVFGNVIFLYDFMRSHARDLLKRGNQ